MTTDRFFAELPNFSSIHQITEDAHYAPVPEDWCVIISDIVSSTKAIETGRYKDVNTIGAATIVSVQNALGGIELPFAFGGDGATVLIPNNCRERVIPALRALESLASKKFNLDLRIGIISVKDILGAGFKIEVAKFEIVHGKSIAVFRGEGLSRADRLIKEDSDGRYILPKGDFEAVNLDGLSCRWHNIPNKSGCILSLIIKAKPRKPKETYSRVIAKLNQILNDSLVDSNPVNPESMSYRSFFDLVEDESRYHSGFSVKRVLRYLEIFVAVLVFRYRIPPLIFHPHRYSKSMRTHSDRLKFNDQLQMVVDCSPEQRDEIVEYLGGQKRDDQLWYGMHESDSSLMTCYVHDMNPGNHIHFVDGGDGGYAMASKQLKEQMLANPS